MSAECCESFTRTDVRGETIPDSRSCRASNEMLQRVTERRLTEADRRVLRVEFSTELKAPMVKWTKSTFLATFSRKFIFVS